jgi:hypothetical protein
VSILRGVKELDVKVMSISGIVNDTKLMMVDGVRGMEFMIPEYLTRMLTYMSENDRKKIID